ncbi:MAG TPA: hypothetical protein VFC02_24810 [Anaerolineales bacterium]|nr:hypothetical protein [Anaerolineales bacterium]
MSIELSELVERLQGDVPDEGGVPSEEQYENAVKDAVRDFSERCGVTQIGMIDVVSGTATYDLPADFLKLIKLTTLTGEGVLHSSSGQLIPLSSDWCEKPTIRNGQITFYPIPRYTLTRDIYYKAAWILTGEDEDYGGGIYETLSEREARIVLLKAKANAKTKLANAQAGDSIKYSFGAVSEDLGGMSESSRNDAKKFENEYLNACEVYNGQVGIY